MGLAAGATGANFGVEAATMEQGPAVAASWPSSAVGLKIESVLRLSACPGALAQRKISYIADFTMALKAISRMCSLISSGVHSSSYNVATLTYFSWSRMRAVVRDDCEARE